PAPSAFLRISVLLDGASMEGRIDADSPRCIVSHAMAATYESVPSRAVIHAQYLGTNFTVEVPVDIGDINCDVVVGREWISLLRLVPAALCSRARSSPSLEGGSYYYLPEAGRNYVLPVNDLSSSAHSISDRNFSEQLLMEAPFGGSSTTSGWTLFDSNREALHRRCVSHGITVVEQTDPQSALLKHVFTGADALATVQLADIAQAIGLVASGAKVVQRKLVSMLEDYKSGCASLCVIVNNVEGLTRGGLLSVGFAHGVTLQGNRDCMRDTLISHLSSGECALHACKNLPACASIMQTFVVGHVSPDRDQK
ncbi:hypothetical protein EV363DRAFT_1198921, partial [Boletus edulis]